MGVEGADRADRTNVAAVYMYIVVWLEHHGNRLYWRYWASEKKVGWTGLEWSGWIPLILL